LTRSLCTSEQLFEPLFQQIEIYPRLSPILCVLALKRAACDKHRLCEFFGTVTQSIIDDLSLVWPILLSLTLDEESRALMSQFLAVNSYEDFNQIQIIVDFFVLFERDDLVTRYFRALFECPVDVFVCDFCVQKCFELIFFHINMDQIHSELLLRYFEGSPFDVHLSHLRTKRKRASYSILSFSDLFRFARQDFGQIKFHCRVVIDENLSILDSSILRFGATWGSSEELADVLKYLMDRSESPHAEIGMTTDLFAVLEEMKDTFDVAFRTRVSAFFRRFIEQFRNGPF
jgi:phosphate starvation-inducible membrane PsiE